MKIGFIGAGNMAGAIVRGICGKGLLSPEEITVSNPSPEKLERLSAQTRVRTTRDNRQAASDADILFLCVKPGKIAEVCGEIRDALGENTLVVSIAAGKTLAVLEELLGSRPILRVMPNAPALTGDGLSALCPNEKAAGTDKVRKTAELLESVGEVVFLEEKFIDLTGQIAGASPAWIAMIMEAMTDGAVLEGMSRETAYKLVAAGVAGAGRMAYKLGGNPSKIKDMVTSPGGTTIEGLRVLEERGVRGAFMDAVIASAEKAKKL